MKRIFPRAGLIIMSGLLGCLILCSDLVSGASEDHPHATYRTTVGEVRMTFFSRDETGGYSRNLKASDFVIVDDGFVVRSFHSFTRLHPTRIEAFVLIDASESVAGQFRREINAVLQLMNGEDWIDDNRISVAEFGGSEPAILCAGDCRTNRAWVQRLGAAGGAATPLFDAVVFAARLAAQHPAPDTAFVLIVFSDGKDTISANSVRDAIDAAVAAQAQIYAVDVNAPGRCSQGGATLREMAAATGGRYFSPDRQAAGLLAALSEDLQASYMVTYQPPSRASGFHSVRILPSHNLNLQFRCRYGYHYEEPVADGGAP